MKHYYSDGKYKFYTNNKYNEQSTMLTSLTLLTSKTLGPV